MHGDRADSRAVRPEFPALPVALGPVVVDWGRLVVVRDGVETRVTPKAAEVLQLLLSHPDETVPRARIFEAAWPGSYSSDEVLTQVIAELRRVLGDSAREPQLIDTIPKLGYRWIGPAPTPAPRTVRVATGAPVSEPAPPVARRTHGVFWLAAVLVGIVAVAWLAWAPRTREPEPAAPAVPVASPALPAPAPVTVEPGVDLDPDLDGNGLRVAYIHGGPEGVALRIRDLDGDGFQTLAVGPDGTPSAPTWSPDGTSLAFVWRAAGLCEIRIAELATGAVRTVVSGCPVSIPTSPAWTPSGDGLLFSRSAGEYGSMEQRHVAIFRVGLDGTGLAQLSDASRRMIADIHPRVSPDGLRIAFVRDGDARNRVLVMAIGGGETTEMPLPVWPYRVEWAADDVLLVAGHGRTPAEIWRVPLDGARASVVATAGAGPGMSASLAGNTLVHEHRTIDDNLWSVPYGNPEAPVRVTDQTRSEIAPRVSYDGTRLAWLSDQSGALEVHVRETAGGGERRLSSFAPESALDLRWSPDARHLVIVVGTLDGKRLAVIDSDGARLPLPASLSALHVAQADFSGDGRYVLLAVEDEGRRELRRIPFPALTADEPMLDEAIASFAPIADSADLWFTRLDDARLARLVAATGAIEPQGATVLAAPADQWIVRDGRLLVMRQVERSADARVTLFDLDGSKAVATWTISAPQPPLGRNVDLGAGRVWFARRDLDEVDLVALPLP